MKDRKDLEELIVRAWVLVDFAEGRLCDPALADGEKVRWAGVLASAIGTLNKLLWKAGVGKLQRDDLAVLLGRIPKKYRGLKVFERWMSAPQP